MDHHVQLIGFQSETARDIQQVEGHSTHDEREDMKDPSSNARFL